MKRIYIFTIGVIMEMPDDTVGVHAPLPQNPLDELAARLRRETCCGRDCGDNRIPDVTAWMAAAFRECHK